jgi:NAD(P)-dependent dehydrogenase (short-subunit alcohol dehydrogenase family)
MRNRPMETALVTGAASGMGQRSALVLAAGGLNVLAADLDRSGAEETARLAQRTGGRVRAVTVDITQPDSVDRLFETARSKFDRLDFFVHAAAIMGETAFIEDISMESWRRLIAVNLDGAFYCCRETVRWMKETGGGRMVLFSSVAAMQPTPGAIGYSVAKAGVNMLARNLASETAKHNIRVNVIAPGYVDTPMLAGLPKGFSDYIIRKTPLKRLGDVEEIGGLVAFLASPEADFFTGQILSPNGGLVM